MHKTPHIILCYFPLNMFLYVEQKMAIEYKT